ncbi:MAG TPA: DUF167 domain-containing protein [Egibacteraceae bacterium]|nr:DUF167 domain-containing protein [Egibacteraceae bacterium]
MASYGSAVREHPEGALLLVRLVPRASSTKLAGMDADRVKLRVSAPPVDGRANAEALEHLGHVLGVRARDVVLISGERSRSKTVLVRGVTREAVLRRLNGAAPLESAEMHRTRSSG